MSVTLGATETRSSSGGGVVGSNSGGVSHLRLWLQNRQVQRGLANVVALLAFGAYVQLRTGDFFTTRNLDNLSVQIVVVVIIASAETFVMIAGAIDVSVSGVAVLTGVVSGLIIQQGVPLALAFVLASAVGALVGVLNAVLVVRIGITSLVATIGTLYVCEGVANILTNGIPIAGLPESYATLGNGFIGPVPIAVPTILGTVALFAAIQRWNVLGRHTIAAGSNSAAAYLAGVKVARTVTWCLLLCGAFAGFGGVVYASRLGAPVPVLDNDLLFQVIVACVVGGTSLSGGEGSVIGTMIGAVLIGAINNGLDLLGVTTYWQNVALGILLVLAVGFDVALRRDSFALLRRRITSGFRIDAGNRPRMNKYRA
jgi:ribose transport system permease protein